MVIVYSWIVFFLVRKYTGRIYLYSCIQGVETWPTSLFNNFKQKELETKDPDNLADLVYKPALVKFLEEWNSLRPIEQRKLYSKPLQLPLSVELCLMESQNHDKDVYLKILLPFLDMIMRALTSFAKMIDN